MTASSSESGDREPQSVIDEIIQTLEKADELFRLLEDRPQLAATLWDNGLDKLTAALWVYEKGESALGEYGPGGEEQP